MEGLVEVRYVKATEVTKDDIDDASLVYFSKYPNNYIQNIMVKDGTASSSASETTFNSKDKDLKADVALYLYIQNVSAGKAIVCSSTERISIVLLI